MHTCVVPASPTILAATHLKPAAHSPENEHRRKHMFGEKSGPAAGLATHVRPNCAQNGLSVQVVVQTPTPASVGRVQRTVSLGSLQFVPTLGPHASPIKAYGPAGSFSPVISTVPRPPDV